MRKALIMVIACLVVVCLFVNPFTHHYVVAGRIINLTGDFYLVNDVSGHVWQVWGARPGYRRGDKVELLVYDNLTSTPYDDRVVKATYLGR